MARRRGGLGNIIHSVKNIVDGTFLGVAAGVSTIVPLAVTVNDYVGGVTEVPVGSKISSVYLFVQITNDVEVGAANVDWYIAKGPNVVLLTIPAPGATGGTPNRKFILHEEKGIPGGQDAGAYPLTFRGVIRIPRGRQRMAEDDQIKVVLRGTAAYNACVKCIYKFYE